ncbi:hypothetical protein ACEWY4_011970 [Coilia grayii]|uniref:Ig-like domain-containing protein n=1 Tax=Coilia grayii TaxID=363190 RepID=A0ABD1JZ60_9TELE
MMKVSYGPIWPLELGVIPESGFSTRHSQTLGATVTCLAAGFYPRHINLTLLRDGQPVPDHQITGGELLPNADETYQMRKSLEVSAEELQQHHYTCTAEHLSLDNKLDIYLGSHSLWMMATYISGKTPFPQFSAYAVLDDIVFGRYYTNEGKAVHIHVHTASKRTFDEDDTTFAAGLLHYVHGRMENRVSELKNFFNHSDISVLQKAVCCELLEDDKPGMMMTTDVHNGELVVVDHYDGGRDALRIEWMHPNMENKGWTQSMNFSWRYRMTYYPNCIKYLKKHLLKEKNRVLKKVKPRVRLLQKTLPDSRGAKVTCLATGFYPRHINLTLLRDGQPVPDHQITGGELLPNADETYQMRKSLEVSAEELQQHHYTCTAEHLSLDNKLDFGLEYEPGEALLPIAASILVLLVVVLVGGTAGFILWKRRLRGSHSLWIFSTFIIGETPFPEYSTVGMLDDIQLGYYDSNVRKIIYRQYRSEHVQEEEEDASNIFGEVYRHMKHRALLSSQKLNSTHVKPRVRLLQQALKASGGAKVTCLATGFYPRHLNLTLLRDGQPVPDHQITGGELLPNADETYQMRKSLEVSAEELQQHHYTCTAEHLSLDNKLGINLGNFYFFITYQ